MDSVIEMSPPPPAEALCLPPCYVQRTQNQTLDTPLRDTPYWSGQRLANAARYQFHVYAWAAHLIRVRHLRSVLDVGCGVGVKLREHIAPVCDDITGIDQPSAIAGAREQRVPATFIEGDLERAGCDPGRTFDLIICADVLEHLLDPRPAMDLITRCCHERSLVLLSTPDRPRRRGRTNMESLKPEHVREWSIDEFARFATRAGLRVLRRRLRPQDDAPVRSAIAREVAWRLHLAPTSRLCCAILLCERARP